MLEGISAHERNLKIEYMIWDKEANGTPYTKEEIKFIRQYSGAGGKAAQGATGRGLLHEFYTPPRVAALMWKAAIHYGYDGGAVIEPAAGTGNLIVDAPDRSRVVAFERSQVSSRIIEASFPEVTVHRLLFEAAFLEPRMMRQRYQQRLTWLEQYPFSLAIGNPPFGRFGSVYSNWFRGAGAPTYESFFIYYGLKLLRPGGLLVYLIPSNFLRNGITYNQIKLTISHEGDFVDAVRLPPVVGGTEIPLDVLILRRKK